MSEGLGDFFKLLAEDKKKKKEEMKELVGEIDIDSIFSQVKESIAEDKENSEKVTKQAVAFESWLFSETEEEKEEIVAEVAEDFREEVQQEDVALTREERIAEEVEEETTISKSIKVLDTIKEQEDPLNDTQFATFDDLKKHYQTFLDRISVQLSSLGGGGIEDAPKTGGPYVRQNQAWSELGTLDIIKGTTGYELTGGFVERTTGQSGSNDIGTDFEYTQELAESQTWKRFGFSASEQVANDAQYWGETNPNFDQTKGVFGGLYLPNGFTNLIDYTDTSVGAAVTTGNLKYTAANGSYDFKEGSPGMFGQIRFSYNVTPLVAGTTIETALIWHTRDESDNVTFSFTLTNQPITYDSNTVGRTLLNRVEITSYFASDEDVNARALPAIRADNRCIIQPLSTLVTISI